MTTSFNEVRRPNKDAKDREVKYHVKPKYNLSVSMTRPSTICLIIAFLTSA